MAPVKDAVPDSKRLIRSREWRAAATMLPAGSFRPQPVYVPVPRTMGNLNETSVKDASLCRYEQRAR